MASSTRPGVTDRDRIATCQEQILATLAVHTRVLGELRNLMSGALDPGPDPAIALDRLARELSAQTASSRALEHQLAELPQQIAAALRSELEASLSTLSSEF